MASGAALERPLADLPSQGLTSLPVSANERNVVHRWQIAQAALKHRLPSIWPWRAGPDAGGLLSYAADRRAIYTRAGDAAGRILKGSAPSTLPVQQPRPPASLTPPRIRSYMSDTRNQEHRTGVGFERGFREASDHPGAGFVCFTPGPPFLGGCV